MTSRVKVAKKAIKDEGLADLMNQMLGVGDLNLEIVVPKYLKVHECLCKLSKILDILIKMPIWDNTTYVYEGIEEEVEKMIKFNEKTQELTDTMAAIIEKLDKYTLNMAEIPKELREEFTKSYEDIKKSGVIADYLTSCDALIVYEADLKKNKPEDPQYKWILGIPGVSFCPLNFSNVDFKHIITNIIYERDTLAEQGSPESESELKNNYSMLKFITIFLAKFLDLSYGLYKVLTSPDIDVSEFVNLIMDNIGNMKKHIPRCEKAFKKITDSVEMLRSNFDNYYKDFLETKSPTIIMQSFIMDIAKDVKADADLARQFREIVKFYEKSTNQIKDPKLKILFDKAKENLNSLDRYYNINRNKEESDLK